MATVPACQSYEFRFCKYGDRCRHQHNHTVCEDHACEIFNCSFRHPRPCRFYKQYGRCKFGNYCQYSHVKFVDLEYKNILEKLMDKLNEMVDQKLTKVFNSLQDEISNFGKMALHMERNLRNFKSDHAPQIVPTPHHIHSNTYCWEWFIYKFYCYLYPFSIRCCSEYLLSVLTTASTVPDCAWL